MEKKIKPMCGNCIHNNEHYKSIQNKVKFNSTKDTNNYKLVDNFFLLNNRHNNINSILSSNNLKYPFPFIA